MANQKHVIIVGAGPGGLEFHAGSNEEKSNMIMAKKYPRVAQEQRFMASRMSE